MSGVTVKATVQVEYRGWNTPNFANTSGKAPGGAADKSTHVKDLDQNALDALVEAWIKELCAKADKTSPWRKAAMRG